MRLLLAALLLVACPVFAAEDNFDFFEKNIRPVLAAKCYGCHNSASKAPMGGLTVDTRDGLRRGGKSGAPAVVPGKPEDSLLLRAIEHTTKDLKMPPGQALPAEQVQAFSAWIKMGAPDPRDGVAPVSAKPAYDWDKERKHWAYQPLRNVAPPAENEPEWNRTAVDRFLRAKLREKGLHPLARTDRRTLLRRVTFNLTGLPPTAAETDAFLADASPSAFEKVVERLLASPAYGEHWGRHWLDVVRYADTAGETADYPVPVAWRYRNYVIDAFNADKPYDEFLREQIAGDILAREGPRERYAERVTATGYLAISRRFGFDSENYHHLTIQDTLDNLGQSMLGLTLGCARCHAHKYDPVSMPDYYALSSSPTNSVASGTTSVSLSIASADLDG